METIKESRIANKDLFAEMKPFLKQYIIKIINANQGMMPMNNCWSYQGILSLTPTLLKKDQITEFETEKK